MSESEGRHSLEIATAQQSDSDTGAEESVKLHYRKNRNSIFNKKAHDKELFEELEKEFYCGTCSLGFNELEDYRHHVTCDEEHQFHVTRRREALVPGLGYCGACNSVIQQSQGWSKHLTTAHGKCVDSLRAIGENTDFSLPLGCTTAGVPGDPIPPLDIDVKKANSSGYRNYATALGNPVVGLGKVIKGATEGNFFCKSCSKPFTFKARISHLASVHHRRRYFEQFQPEYLELVMKDTQEYHHVRRKFRFAFYAAKIEEKEKESENAETKALRQQFFDVQSIMKMELESPNIPCKEKGKAWHSLPASVRNPQAENFRKPPLHDVTPEPSYQGHHETACYNGGPPPHAVYWDEYRAPFLQGRRDYQTLPAKQTKRHPNKKQRSNDGSANLERKKMKKS